MKPLLVGLGLLGAAAGLVPAGSGEPDERQAATTCGGDRATDPRREEPTPWGHPGEVSLEGSLEREPPTVNGITLRIKAKQVLTKGSNQIVVDWTVTYDGTRPPLIMLKPCLGGCHRNGDTMLAIFATGKDKRAYCVSFRSPAKSFWLMPAAPGPGCYLAARPGRPATGRLVVSTEQVRRNLLEHLPEAFDRDAVPPVHVELYHDPTERGEEYGLDAWTGQRQLESNIVPLKLSQW